MYNAPQIQMLTIPEATALVSGVSKHFVRQLCIEGKIPTVKAGRKYLIRKDAFLDYFQIGQTPPQKEIVAIFSSGSEDY